MTAATRAETAVVALGGNALLRQGDAGTVFDQRRRAAEAAAAIIPLIARGAPVVITHGNGPVVGTIFLRHEECARQIPPMPLDVCGAESQGNIGYLLATALDNALGQAGLRVPVTTLLTRVAVDPDDPAFRNPTKPVGGFLSEEDARRCPFPVALDAGRGYRRVVPSPRPRHILELPAVRALLAARVVPVAAGGGGVPVVQRPDGSFMGVDAVVDKDLASSLLARELGAQTFIILTDVDAVYLGFLTATRRRLPHLRAAEAERYLRAGEFLPGSMAPKIEAALEFLKAGGSHVVVCLPEDLPAALAGHAGTRIVP